MKSLIGKSAAVLVLTCCLAQTQGQGKTSTPKSSEADGKIATKSDKLTPQTLPAFLQEMGLNPQTHKAEGG